MPIVSLVLASDRMSARRADPARRSRHHPRRCAAINGVAAGDRGGRRQPRDLDRRAAGRHGLVGGHRRRRSSQAVQAQNLAAPVGQLEGRAHRAGDPPARGGSRAPRTSRSWWSAARNGQLVRLGAGGRRARRHRRAAHARPVQRPAGGRHRHHQVEGGEHHQRRGRGQGGDRGDPADPAAGGEAVAWCATPASGCAARCATSRRR